MATVLVGPRGRPHCLPIIAECAWRGHKWQHIIFGDESWFHLYPVDGRMRVRRLPRERFLEGCQVDNVQVGGGSIHVFGAFHKNAKSPFVPLDRNVNGMVYKDIYGTPWWHLQGSLSVRTSVIKKTRLRLITSGKSLPTSSRRTSPRWTSHQDPLIATL